MKFPGLPNITGTFFAAGTVANDNAAKRCTGPFKMNDNATVMSKSICDVNLHDYGSETDFNASWSNTIYGASSTVQPPALSLVPQIKY